MVKSKNYSWLRSNSSIVTFKDLKKRVTLESQQQTRLFESLRNKPFWYWNIEEHKKEDIKSEGNCCFNHIVGLPSKERIEKPIFDYQKILYDTLLFPDNYNSMKHTFKHKHLKQYLSPIICEQVRRALYSKAF